MSKVRIYMKDVLTCFLLFCFFLSCKLQADVPVCLEHRNEVQKIRYVAANALFESHKLTGDIIGSLVFTAEDLAWDTVKHSVTYSDFSKTFQGGIRHCNKKGKFLASNRLYRGINDVGDLYLILYNDCITNHHNYRSVFERGKIHFDRGNIEECLADIDDLLHAGFGEEFVKDVKPSDLLITKGQAFIEMGKFEKAIEALSEAINKEPRNKEAYFHRAAAYFETGKFDESLKDYLMSDKGKELTKSSFVASKEFTEALIISTCKAASEAVVDFVPSLSHSAYGLSKTLWAVHWSANPVNPEALVNIKNFANACHEVGECVVEYCKNLDAETIDGYVDCVKILYQRYDQLSESEKGEQIGYIIGTYGVDFLAGVGAAKGVQFANKGVQSYRILRSANQTCNFERMVASGATKESITSSALKHAAEREGYLKNLKIEWDKQNKHIVGKHNYIPNKSILEHPDPESLLKKYAGTGMPVRESFGKPGYQEIVDFEEFIGYYVCEKTQTEIPTTWGKIHYSKNGVHIVPTKPRT